MSEKDWSEVIKGKKAEYELKNPNGNIMIEDNVLVFNDQVNKSGKPYKRVGIKTKNIEPFKEKWNKILNALGVLDQ